MVFDVLPSLMIMKKATEDIIKIKTDLRKADLRIYANFVNSNSDAKYDSTFFAKGKFLSGLILQYF